MAHRDRLFQVLVLFAESLVECGHASSRFGIFRCQALERLQSVGGFLDAAVMRFQKRRIAGQQKPALPRFGIGHGGDRFLGRFANRMGIETISSA